MAEPVIKRNPKTGEVAVQIDGGWEIFPNEQEAAKGVMLGVAQHPDVAQSQGMFTGINDKIREISGAAQQNVTDFYGPGLVSSGLNAMIPRNLPELGAAGASMLVGGPLGLGAKAAAGPLVSAAARVAAPTLTAMGLAGASADESPITEGLKAGVGSLIPEMLSPALGFMKQLTTRGGFIRQGMKDASDLVAAIRKEVPGLDNVVRGVKDLFAGRDGGQRALGDAFRALDSKISGAFGQTRVTFPVVEDGAIVTKQVSMTEASQAVRDLKEMARKARDAAKTSTDFKKSNEVAAQIQSQANQAEAAFTRILNRKDPALSAAYADANMNYKKGIKIIELLKDSNAVQSSPYGTFLNNEKLAQYLTENIEHYPLMQYPELWRVATRTKPGMSINPGLSDVARTTIGGERVFLPSLGPIPGGSVPLPKLMRLQQAGSPQSLMGQGVGGLPQWAADLLSQRLTAGVVGE